MTQSSNSDDGTRDAAASKGFGAAYFNSGFALSERELHIAEYFYKAGQDSAATPNQPPTTNDPASQRIALREMRRH
jgi:hypothetical protein